MMPKMWPSFASEEDEEQYIKKLHKQSKEAAKQRNKEKGGGFRNLIWYHKLGWIIFAPFVLLLGIILLILQIIVIIKEKFIGGF